MLFFFLFLFNAEDKNNNSFKLDSYFFYIFCLFNLKRWIKLFDPAKNDEGALRSDFYFYL